MFYQFPEKFWWGSAASGPQTEGRVEGDGKGDSVWDMWFKKEPTMFFNQVGPEHTSEVYKHYKSDVALMKKIGHNSFRTSIQWSRLIPDGLGEVNQTAVDFYNDYFDSLIAQGIEPFVNLYHFDMPNELQKIGGWENRQVVDAYVIFAKTCFELFGGKIRKWFTHNEPIVPVEAGYLYQFHYPMLIDMKKAVQVAYHEALSNALAVQAFKAGGYQGEIGIILNLTPSYPRDSNDSEDVLAAYRADLFFNRSFLDVTVLGHYPQDLIDLIKESDCMPETEPDDAAIFANNTIDLLGINYYQPRRIKKKESPITNPEIPMPDHYFDIYEMPGRKMNPYRGWEIYEKGIYDLLINVRDNYGNISCYISENGMGVENEERFIQEDGSIQDDYRIEFVKDHLKYVHQAIQEGVNVKGYHMWTCMDNWSWCNAYKNRYGFISVDLDNDYKRTIKASGYWFADTAMRNGFED